MLIRVVRPTELPALRDIERAAGAVFRDVPCQGGAFDPWIEDLSARGVTSGCGGGNYCPANAVTRAQMAVFLTNIFSLPLP